MFALAFTSASGACALPAAGAPTGGGRDGGSPRVVLVELFTSQGCSACPAADALVGELPRLGFGPDRVLPLAFHVDYWDELGWKDPFSQPAFTARQHWYVRSEHLRPPARSVGLRGAYTPQMIVDGRVHFSGQRRDVALSELTRAGQRPQQFHVDARARAHGATAMVTTTVTALSPPEQAADWRLQVALAARAARTRVATGENGGETLHEAAIVRDLSAPLPIPSTGPLTAVLTKPAELSWDEVTVVAFVQSARTRAVGAAAAARFEAAGADEPRVPPAQAR